MIHQANTRQACEYPPRQKAAGLTLDEVMETLVPEGG